MNAAFNVGFIIPQSAGEQLFNQGSLREFHDKTAIGHLKQAVREFQRSLDGLDGAIRLVDVLLSMLEKNKQLPEFEAALAAHLEELGVDQLPRVAKVDPRAGPIRTLEDILLAQSEEFAALREMTLETVEQTLALRDEIAAGKFVATVLEANTGFNQAKISLGFGRGIVENFVSTSCHATILAIEDIWPLGFEFLLELK